MIFKTVENNSAGNSQVIHRFENNRGASVVRGAYSYGGKEGLFELAVLWFDGDNYTLDYSTSITSDVEGCLSEDEVNELLGKIEALS